MNLPDVAEALGIDVKRVRGLVADRRIIGVRRGERGVFQVPAAFLVDGEDGTEVLPSLRGTLMVLGDVGMSDAEVLRWLFEPEESIGTAPVEALRSGRTHEVRRVAQALA